MGGKQLGFGDYEQSRAKKRTKRARFLSEMDALVPWQALIDLIEPSYPKTNSKGGCQAFPLATMLPPLPGKWASFGLLLPQGQWRGLTPQQRLVLMPARTTLAGKYT
jgi:hypothetical protein